MYLPESIALVSPILVIIISMKDWVLLVTLVGQLYVVLVDNFSLSP